MKNIFKQLKKIKMKNDKRFKNNELNI